MNELIKIVNHDVLVQAVDARELHEKLEIKAKYANWIKLQIERADLAQGIDFIAINNDITSPPSKEYFVTVEAGKNIAMLSQTEKGKQVRAYFIECEKRLKSKAPMTYIEALQAHLQSEIDKELLRIENQKLITIIDNEFGYSSILRAAIYAGVHEKTFSWRSLKSCTLGLGMEVKRVPSTRYGYQNLYPIKAFQITYPDIDFDDLNPESHDDKLELVITKRSNIA